ncbi:MAG: class I tRNA ligase family protein, partial [Candidatus Margulisbacteria bacterium]|nr:class I tRNA ligase family protein [Candidatus Margulisiibacteriota bacterium]
LGNFVSNEDGTGLVHIAPGHGYDDYLVGLEYKLPMIMPVDESGIFTEEADAYAGLPVFEANKNIVQDLEKSGHLLKMEWMKHSYPHCWRCHKPVIFRATEQWFIAMDSEFRLRDKAMQEIKKTDWYPDWGEKRIGSMVEVRPDWCISRQRFWGIPIPVFYCKKCNEPHFQGAFNKAVVELVAKEGTNAWFTRPADEILPSSLKCKKCGHQKFEKDKNIMDVWLESGASHHAVLHQHKDLRFPADLYLEGSDQHRGWFQSSLLASVGAFYQAPYKAVLTHGFTIDEKGQKMSKSLGNTIDPLQVLKIHGADILRLWASSTDFKNDVILSDSIIGQVKDAFTKIRNTLRFMISNLYDYDPQKQIMIGNFEEIDGWILEELNLLIDQIGAFYENYEFHQIYHTIYNFCVIQLSSLYLDIQKDNLYCNAKTEPKRRSCQAAMEIVSGALIKMLAPVLSFSMEDVYKYLPGERKKSIFLETFPEKIDVKMDKKILEKYKKLLELRSLINIELEKLRKDKVIGSSLEAVVELVTPEKITVNDLAAVLIVSEIKIISGKEVKVRVSKAGGEKCQRCWKYADLTADGLCPRCAEVVAVHEDTVIANEDIDDITLL